MMPLMAGRGADKRQGAVLYKIESNPAVPINIQIGGGKKIALVWGSNPYVRSIEILPFEKAVNVKKKVACFQSIGANVTPMALSTSGKIDVLKNKRISVIGGNSGIIYEFNFRLELQNVRLSHSFQRKHKKAFAEGKVKSELDENYIRRLEQGFLYWNGDKWVSEPAMNNWYRSRN